MDSHASKAIGSFGLLFRDHLFQSLREHRSSIQKDFDGQP